MAEISTFYPPNKAPIYGSEGCWTFDAVEAQLVEAMGYLHRMPDRHRQRRMTASDGPWGLILPEAWGGEVGFDVAIMQIEEARERMARERPPLTTAQVDRMNLTLEWVAAHVPARGELRRIVGVTIGYLAREGGRADWIEIRRRGGFRTSPDTLRKTYSRAIAMIAARLNRCTGL